MKNVEFAVPYAHRRDPLTLVRYRKGKYSVSDDVEVAARKAGVLVEKKNGGSGNRAAAGDANKAQGDA
jgi:hypothetical protein